MRTMFILAALAAALGSSAAAQDGSEAATARTVEGAQRFLSRLYAQGGYEGHLYVFGNGPTWRSEARIGFTRYLARGVLRGVRDDGRCRSVASFERLTHRRISVKDTALPITASTTVMEVPVDWSQVTKVVVQEERLVGEGGNPFHTGDHRVVIGFRNGTYVEFLHRSEEEAKRAGFATEFLKGECGLKAEEGF